MLNLLPLYDDRNPKKMKTKSDAIEGKLPGT